MASYTNSLRLTLPVTGTEDGTWGDTVNDGITTLIDTSIAGTAAITMVAADYTLTSNSGATDEARSMFLTLGGTPGASFNVICPTKSKLYFVKNNTAFAQTVKTLAGTGISVPASGAITVLYCDGTNVVNALTQLSSLTLSTALAVLSGGTGVTTSTGSGSNVLNTSPTLVTPALGTPSALVGTNITGTAAGLTAGSVTTNANLTGAITSSGNATSLGSFTSLQLLTALTNETGTGSAVFATSPTLVTPILGTPQSGVVTNLTGTASININGTVGATTANTGAFTTLSSTGNTTLGDASADTVTINGTVQPGVVISGTSSGDALRITQVGTGNALVVEDSANPDASPFVIDQFGRVVVGHTVNTVPAGTNPFLQIQSTGSTQSAILGWSTASASSPNQTFYRSASGVIGTQGVVVNGADLGALNFYGDDGTAFIQAAQILTEVDGTPGTNDMPGRLVFSTTAGGAASPTERFRIGSAGQLGVAGANYGTSGQALVSQGSGAPPTWGTAGISSGKSIALAMIFGF